MPLPFDPVGLRVTIELELDGDGAGWTDVTRDTRTSVGIQWDYGIDGSGPRDRVASTGSCSFGLDNSEGNSAGRLGYYMPGHPFVRAGFDVDIACRIGLHYGGGVSYKRYRIVSVSPTTERYGSRIVRVTGVDWMDEAARYKLTGIAIQVNQRSDQIFSTIYQEITRQPANTSIAAGQDTYAYALDNLRDESETALSAIQKLMQSELGQAFVRRDATDGETLVFEDRHARVTSTDNDATFRGDMVALAVDRERDDVLDLVQVSTHLRRVDAAATTVLYSLGDDAPEVPAGDTITPFGPYRDPSQEAARVGGTGMVTPVASTDYTMNSQADGLGTDLTANFTVVASFGANGVRFTVTNNGSQTGYVTLLQCRGQGIYDYARAIMESGTAGGNTFLLDQPYQSDANVAQGAADYLRNLYGTTATYVRTMSYYANRHHLLATYARDLDISSRIGLQDDVVGLETEIQGTAAVRGWFVNACAYRWDEDTRLRVTYTLAPADNQQYWILDQVGASELGITTRLAFA